MPPIRDIRRSPDGSAATLLDGRREHQAHGSFIEYKLHRINILQAWRFARPLFPFACLCRKAMRRLPLGRFFILAIEIYRFF
jgi:hypothetical protein